MTYLERHHWLAAAVAAIAFSALPAAARADTYDPHQAGHPLRILAYFLYPIGVALDYGIMRPCHWLGHQPGFREVFGHED